MMEYKGYHAKPEYSAEDGCLVGKVLGIRDSVSFHGASVDEFETAFREAVDDYLQFCEEVDKSPDREYSGQFILRISPELHRDLVLAATRRGESLNTVASEAIGRYLAAV
ncbi:MAG: type II toxin-antitoxin system HicB family antitoxin [Clostridiales Family XIII bacterium]|jgi:predicted HicB family RNase H-like nuclease|nr:type II toxin-antitoxin system HicB family antitoxin [Clostridiales Family XIII bacterium]